MFKEESLRTLIEQSGIPYKEGAVSFIFTCPRCSKKQKLYIRKKDGRFICFKCAGDGLSGRAEYILSQMTSLSLNELKETLYGDDLGNFTDPNFKLSNVWNKDEDDGYDLGELKEEPPLVQWNPDFVGIENDLFLPGYKYLIQNRGLTDTHIKYYDLKYHPSWKCVVFPVKVDGNLLGWQERGINRNFKYTLTGFAKEKVLMFQDRLNSSEHAVLTEGPIDGLKTHICGGNVVSMGKGVSTYQLDIIKSKVKKLYLALDPDATQELDNICKYLYNDMDIYLMPPAPGRKDHGESTEEEVYEQFKKAKKYIGQIFVYFKRGLNE